MARQLRIEFEGAFYHVYGRGLERREIYRDAKDYEKFLEIAAKVQKRRGFVCHGYCLMPNHYHLFLETPQGNLGRVMKDWNGQYTQSFNQRYGRVGPLLQGRYKSKLVDQDSYSLQLSRYIHLNPVKAGLSRHPAGWKWSSYGVFTKAVKRPEFLETDWLLEQIGNSKRKFEEFTLAGVNEKRETFDGLILGAQDFIDKIKRRFVKKEKDSSLSGLRQLRKYDRVKAVEEAVAVIECDSKLRRKLLAYGLKSYTGLSLADIGKKIGSKTDVAVSQAVRRLNESRKRKENNRLGKMMRELDAKCKL